MGSTNRFDHRPFLYNIKWKWQFRAIDDESERLEKLVKHKDKVGGVMVLLTWTLKQRRTG
jgi:hypothetical protein